MTLTAGLLWQFVLVLWLVRREQGTLRWRVLRQALWLTAPRNARTGRRGCCRTRLVLVPMTAVFAVEQFPPVPAHPADRDFEPSWAPLRVGHC